MKKKIGSNWLSSEEKYPNLFKRIRFIIKYIFFRCFISNLEKKKIRIIILSWKSVVIIF